MIYKTLFLINLALIGIFVYIMFLIFFPFKTIEFLDPVFPIEIKRVERGGNLVFTSRYCKHVDLPSTVTRAFINDFTYSVAPMTTFAKSGCNTVKILVTIPKELPPGQYYLHTKYEYKVNPFRTITVVHDSEHFTIIEGGEK